MRSSAFLGCLLLLLVSAAPIEGSEMVEPKPVFHEELARVWDDFARGLHGLGNRLREHFYFRDSREERPLITFMLRHRDDLGLSPEQVRALEQLRSDFQREAIRKEADLRIAEIDLASLLEAEKVDLAQVEAKIREVERLRADLRFARIRTIEQGKEQLTAEQRKKLRELISETQFSGLPGKSMR